MAEHPDNQCPRCDRRLVHTPQGRYCPYCGYDFSIPPEALDAGDYFTGAECGVFGFIAGVEFGAAIGLAATAGEPTATVLPWAAGGGGLVGAVVSGWLGNRLASGVRRSFRRLLLSACGAGMLIFLLAVSGFADLDALVLTGIGSTAVVYLTVSYAARRMEQGGGTRAGTK